MRHARAKCSVIGPDWRRYTARTTLGRKILRSYTRCATEPRFFLPCLEVSVEVELMAIVVFDGELTHAPWLVAERVRYGGT